MMQTLKTLGKKWLFPVPAHLARNQTALSQENLAAFKESLLKYYYAGWRSRDNYSPDKFSQDLQAHLTGRLEEDRRIVIPWLDNARPLKNSRVLEIGCGTGASSVAMAEQGAEVTGIDIEKGALKTAENRCRLHGLKSAFHLLNADSLRKAFKPGTFDSIIFFAALEHMTIAERITSLKQAWSLIGSGGLLVIAETPNRLWFFDSHTSLLPFYHWLPDNLAFDYAVFSPEDNFNTLFPKHTAEAEELFLRRGRGMSYHEIDLSIGPAKDLDVVSSLSTFQSFRFRLKKSPRYRRYKSLLRSADPALHEGFFDEYLYLIIRK